MSLVRFITAGQVSEPLFGWHGPDGIRAIGDASTTLPSLLLAVDELDELEARAHGPSIDPARVVLRCPVPAPRRVLAAAGNYIAAGRGSLRSDAQPWLFAKMADAPLGPDEPIHLPDLGADVVEEIELALVIGRSGREIPVERACDHIAAWTICNDVSARALRLDPDRRGGAFAPFFDWLNGKWFDGFLALGPRLVGRRHLDLADLAIETRVNGELRVAGSTSRMTFTPDELVSFASRLMRLEAGDVIATGMPHGAADEIFLRPGDVVTGTIDGIGSLVNPIAVADQP